MIDLKQYINIKTGNLLPFALPDFKFFDNHNFDCSPKLMSNTVLVNILVFCAGGSAVTYYCYMLLTCLCHMMTVILWSKFYILVIFNMRL